MNWDDIKKFASSSMLFSLDRILAPKLVKLCYFLGLAGIFIWAFDHFYITFSYSFGSGLWGLLEIVVFGLLALVVLRISCEAVIVFFKVHSNEAAEASHARAEPVNLVDELRDAIEELATEEDEETPVASGAKAQASAKSTRKPAASKPATKTGPASKTKAASADTTAAKRRPVTRRTAKRSPKPSTPPSSSGDQT